eukprot:TRINITY_DN4815_c0_g6_i1.p1 TRINITY_DN4815_c0_g6~~TRINITY_DN4815_c0_g6_i1.p1  ORF type:complete len:1112 (+),score=284.52 TRINITY_DN4815_c0_g6_i1:32-3367(+)
MSESTSEVKEKETSFVKRNFLRGVEDEIQKFWADNKVFQYDAPDVSNVEKPKYLVTFPYPYMNGRLHLGHAFTVSKADFAANFQRLKGKQVLFPFGFHCTGMPIKASSDKLRREMAEFGNPPVFPVDAVPETPPPTSSAPAAGTAKADPTAFHSNKSKVKQKTGNVSRQWKIMQALDVPEVDIPKFADANYWLEYFPPYCINDLSFMGAGIDWRRSMITTDKNPYYDSFVRWQFEKLRELGKVKLLTRYTIWSPVDDQPCMDHDRGSGEGVLPQEYTLIKLEVAEPFPHKLASLEGRKVFLVPGTLRPKTMYGQTNCWVLPDGEYGAFETKNGEVFICTQRSAFNMSFQGITKEYGKAPSILDLTGQDLIGTPLRAPLAQYPFVYVLPMLHVSPDKGTGIVTSVPSDAPDDYRALQDLVEKPALRAKFQVKDEWVLPFALVPIINIPGYGDRAAEKVCVDLKIVSQNDRDKLAKAKDLVYTKGFYEGELTIGPYKGQKVKDAKPHIRAEMIANGQAIVYSEPAESVTSRQGEECVVALTDQWYITYGEDEWKKQTEELLKNMNTFSDETRRQFEIALGWLNQWACSRTYGLGTYLPWDQKYLIESLSDSTIYMAYYTISHLLHSSWDSSKIGPLGITPDQTNNEFWEHIFCNGPQPQNTNIPKESFDLLRREFNYWYPVDLRVSGRDLIQNHLSFFLYNHAAIFPPHHQPRGVRTNGFILRNGDKMSKLKGNFVIVHDAVKMFSADGMRFALANAGDGLEDANFEDEVANNGILRLYTQLLWVKDILEGGNGSGGSSSSSGVAPLREGPATSFPDRVFKTEIDRAIRDAEVAYEQTQFRDALKVGFFDLQNARDYYRNVTEQEGMNKDLILRFIEVQAYLLAPICPHFSEKVWQLLGKQGSIFRNGKWPIYDPIDPVLIRQNDYLKDAVYSFRMKVQLWIRNKTGKKPDAKKEKKGAEPEVKDKKQKEAEKEKEARFLAQEATVTISKSFPEWQRKTLVYLATVYDPVEKKFHATQQQMKENFLKDPTMAPHLKDIMGFAEAVKQDAAIRGADALELSMPFDERETLETSLNYITRTLELTKLNIVETDSNLAEKKGPLAVPGKPSFLVIN